MTDKRLISSRACDRLYQVANGTCAKLYAAGKIAGQWRGKARTAAVMRGIAMPKRRGHSLMLSRKHAEEVLGARVLGSAR